MFIQTKLSKRTYLKGREVTIENIREYEGLEQLSDKEAQEAVMTIRMLARMIYESYMKSLKIDTEQEEKTEFEI